MFKHKITRIFLPLFLVLTLAAGMTNAGVTGLVARWTFDEGTGVVALDYAGENVGTLLGLPILPVWDGSNKAPLAGNQFSLRFDGNDYINIPDNPSLDVDTVTLSAWIWIDPANLAEQANIVRKGPLGSGSDRVYGLTIRNTGAVRGFVVLNSSLALVDADFGTPVSKSAWHHIAMTYDGQKVIVYTDGSWNHESSTVTGVIADNDKAVMIGGGMAGWFFKGNIDEVRIYNRVLNANEIASLADTTPPALTLPTDITAEATSPSGRTVTFSPTATDAVDGVLPVICDPASGSVFPLGTTAVNCSVTDANGNTTTGSFKVTVVDTTPPLLNLPSGMEINAMGPDGAVALFSASATDIVDELVPVICVPGSGSVFPVGMTTVNCSATDDSGNFASGSFSVTVRCAFNGFFSPIDMGGVVNIAKAGSAIPIKFSLGGYQGLDIFADGFPKSLQVPDFGSSVPGDFIEQVVTAGSSGLSYDAMTDQYTYVWKTSKLWGGTNRQLLVKFSDGTRAPLVNFSFRK